MRFILLLAAVAIVALVGLFIYGQMLEPETRTITEEVRDGESS